MAVGEFDVSSLTMDEFNGLLEKNFRDTERIRLTLRRAPEKKYEEFDVKLSCNGAKPENVSLALVFYKDDDCKLPKNLDMENYDIIQQVRNKT